MKRISGIVTGGLSLPGRGRGLGWGALLALAALSLAAPDAVPPVGPGSGDAVPLAISVAGNHLVDGSGHAIRLLGVSRSGTETQCARGKGIFDGPSNSSSVRAMASWDVNVVRVPLNEDCWLGINGVLSAYGGHAYQKAVSDYVKLLHHDHLYAILDLHANAPGSSVATKGEVMPDADHSITFWQQVAQAFAGDPAVVFELFSAPRSVSWDCWRDGNGCGLKWRVAGMQTLVDTIRATGARQPIIVSGLGAGGDDLSGWLSHQPSDPLHAVVAGLHVFPTSRCSSQDCWNSSLGPLAGQIPLVSTAVGSNGCEGTFLNSYMSWADPHGVSYLAWAWDTWSSCSGLVSNYDGTPAHEFGSAFRTHLESLVDPADPPDNPRSPAALAPRTGQPTTGASQNQLLVFLLGALAVLAVFALGACVTLTFIVLRLWRSGTSVWPLARAQSEEEATKPAPAAEPEEEEQDVEFYGPLEADGFSGLL